jgi:hypothetical protein
MQINYRTHASDPLRHLPNPAFDSERQSVVPRRVSCNCQKKLPNRAKFQALNSTPRRFGNLRYIAGVLAEPGGVLGRCSNSRVEPCAELNGGESNLLEVAPALPVRHCCIELTHFQVGSVDVVLDHFGAEGFARQFAAGK